MNWRLTYRRRHGENEITVIDGSRTLDSVLRTINDWDAVLVKLEPMGEQRPYPVTPEEVT